MLNRYDILKWWVWRRKNFHPFSNYYQSPITVLMRRDIIRVVVYNIPRWKTLAGTYDFPKLLYLYMFSSNISSNTNDVGKTPGWNLRVQWKMCEVSNLNWIKPVLRGNPRPAMMTNGLTLKLDYQYNWCNQSKHNSLFEWVAAVTKIVHAIIIIAWLSTCYKKISYIS